MKTESNYTSVWHFFQPRKAFLFSLFVGAVKHALKIFILREQKALQIRIVSYREKHSAWPSVLSDHDGPVRRQIPHDLAELGFHLAKTLNPHNLNSFPSITTTLPLFLPISSTITRVSCTL